MKSDYYLVTEEQMLNAMRYGIEETLTANGAKEANDLEIAITALRQYKASHPDSTRFIQTRCGTISHSLSECEIYSTTDESISMIWK